jgi:hypothetical protein
MMWPPDYANVVDVEPTVLFYRVLFRSIASSFRNREMQENPFYNTFNQFIILSCLVLGILEIVTGIVFSRSYMVILGILFVLMGLLWIASLATRYRKRRR